MAKQHKRWRKGQSSSSNPETTKFRDAAKKNAHRAAPEDKPQREILKARRTAPLTVAALAAHNRALSAHDHDGSDSETELTLDQIFAKVRRHMNSPLEAHREACAVLEVVKEAILAEGGQETETAYFATLMTLLEKHKDDPDSTQAVTAVAYLLSLIFPRVPTTVLRARCVDAATVLLETLQTHAGESTSMTKGLLECLGHLLYVQESPAWAQPATHQYFNALFHFTQDSRPKIRHRAHDLICKMLKKPPPPLATHPAAAELTSLLRQRLASASKTDVSPTLHDLSFLAKAIVFLPVNGIQAMCEQLLRLLTLGHPVVTSLSMQCLDALMAAGTESTLTPDLAARLLNALFDYQPHVSDADAYNLWMSVVSKGTALLSTLNGELGYSHLPRASAALVAPLKSDAVKSWGPAAKGLQVLIGGCIKPYKEIVLRAVAQQKDTPLHALIGQLEGCLGYQCSATWGLVLNVLSALFNALGRQSYPLLNKALLSAANLNTVHGFKFKVELRDLIGAAIFNMGARHFFEVHPLELEKQDFQADFPRAWVLPICAEFVKHTELLYFGDELLPLAVRLGNKSRALEGKGETAALAAKLYHQLNLQIWALLPGFCSLPTDGPAGLRKIAKTIALTMEKDSEVAPVIAQSLTAFVALHRPYTQATPPQDGPEHMTHELASQSLSAVGALSKNFLPILFNTYQASRPEARAIIMAAIKEVMGVAPQQVIGTFFEGIVRKLLEAGTGERTEKSLQDMHVFMDLLFAMVPRLEGDLLAKYFKVIKPHMVDEDGVLQKQTYKALAHLWASELPSHQHFAASHFEALRNAVTETLLAASGSAKKNRLKLLVAMVQTATGENLQMIPAVIAEAILSTKEVNEKTRNLAYKLLVEMGNAMKRAAQEGEAFTINGNTVQASLKELFTMVLAGFGGQSPHMVSASVNAIGRLSYEFAGELPADLLDNLMDVALILLQSKSREVLKAALGFLKVVLVAVKPPQLQQHLPALVGALLQMPDEERVHFKMKVRVIFERLIRKFGFEPINSLVPEEHRKLLTNIRKRKERAVRQKREAREKRDQEGADGKTKKGGRQPDSFEDALYGSESEGSDEEYEAKDGSAWLKDDMEDEDMVDFLDPTVVRKVVASKPGQKKKADDWIKFDKSGRMVIDEESDDDGKKKGKGQEDEWEDEEEDEDTMSLDGDKKKRKKAWLTWDNNDDMDLDGKPAKKKRKKEEPEVGTDYKAKKAKGDVKKAGKHDPYAYVPLQRKFMNKRNRTKSVSQFRGVVKKNKRV